MLTNFFNDFETYELLLFLTLLIVAPRNKDTTLLALGLTVTVTSFDLGFSLFDFLTAANQTPADLLFLTLNTTIIIISLMSFNAILLQTTHGLEMPLLLYFIEGFVETLMTTSNIFDGFISIIGFSLALYVSILDVLESNIAREAGIKYFYLSALSSGLVIMGIFNIIFITKETELDLIDLALVSKVTNGSTFDLSVLSLFFILFGLFFKLSAFPGHLWAPEIYEGTSAPTMTLFMTIIKIGVFIFLIKLLTIGFATLQEYWITLLTFSAAGSLIWGCIAALTEKRLRRFFAYTSINQMGFLFLGLIANTDHALDLTIFYFAVYIFSTAVLNYILFDSYVIYSINEKLTLIRPLTFLTDLSGFSQKVTELTPLWTTTVILFSMAGVPPLAGFFAKYLLLLQTFEQGNGLLLLLALGTSLISAYYYLRVIKAIWFEPATRFSAATTLLLPDFFILKSQNIKNTLIAAELTLWVLPIFISSLLG